MTETVALKIVQRIATELSVQPRQVAAAVGLLDEGATVPFIARYRKEVTGNLDDTQLRTLKSLKTATKRRRALKRKANSAVPTKSSRSGGRTQRSDEQCRT